MFRVPRGAPWLPSHSSIKCSSSRFPTPEGSPGVPADTDWSADVAKSVANRRHVGSLHPESLTVHRSIGARRRVQ